MKRKFGVLRDGELVLVSPVTPGACVVRSAEVPVFDADSEMVVHSHYVEVDGVIFAHSKVVPLPVEEEEEEE